VPVELPAVVLARGSMNLTSICTRWPGCCFS
jgi:hypothetical protein